MCSFIYSIYWLIIIPESVLNSGDKVISKADSLFPHKANHLVGETDNKIK